MSDAFLDLVLGSSCAGCDVPGRALCRRCEAALPIGARMSMPTPSPEGLVDVWAAAPYDGLIRSLVLAHKEHRRISLAGPLGIVLATAIATVSDGAPIALVPVPSSPWAVRSRGHDPVLRMARASASALRSTGIDARVSRLLQLVRRPADQSGLTSAERAANLAGLFRARPANAGSPSRTRVLVIDDIVTTGATLREAQRALEVAGHTVCAAVTLASTRRSSLPRSHPGV